jgi:hypothetical protein
MIQSFSCIHGRIIGGNLTLFSFSCAFLRWCQWLVFFRFGITLSRAVLILDPRNFPSSGYLRPRHPSDDADYDTEQSLCGSHVVRKDAMQAVKNDARVI